MAKITSEILQATAPKTRKATRDRFLPDLNKLLPHFEINNELRISAFLATCCLESDYWKATAEYGKGKGRAYARVYKDTGKAYYGRGIIQNTWRDAYENFTEYVTRNWSWLQDLAGVSDAPNFVTNPDLLTEPFWAVLGACWFWHRNKFNKLADSGLKNFFAIQGLTNRGDAEKKALHYESRLAIYETLRRFLSDNFTLDSKVSSAKSDVVISPSGQSDTDIVEPSNNLPENSQPSEMPPDGQAEDKKSESETPTPPTEPVEVEQVKAEQDKPDTLLEKGEKAVTYISGKIMAIPAFILSILGGVWAWFVNLPPIVIAGIFGGGSFILAVYLCWFMYLKNRREQREAEILKEQEQTKRQREQQAHELTILQAKSAMDKNLQTIKIAPQPIENSDAEPIRGFLSETPKLTWRQRITGRI